MEKTGFEFGTHSFEIDFSDADTIIALENLEKTLNGELDSIVKDSSLSEGQKLLKTCTLFDDLIDELLGAGSAQNIFGTRHSLKERIDLTDAIVEESIRQRRDFDGFVQQRRSRYASLKRTGAGSWRRG